MPWRCRLGISSEASQPVAVANCLTEWAAGLESKDLDYIVVDRVFVLSRQLLTSVELSMLEYIAHRNGSTRHSVLPRINLWWPHHGDS